MLCCADDLVIGEGVSGLSFTYVAVVLMSDGWLNTYCAGVDLNAFAHTGLRDKVQEVASAFGLHELRGNHTASLEGKGRVNCPDSIGLLLILESLTLKD